MEEVRDQEYQLKQTFFNRFFIILTPTSVTNLLFFLWVFNEAYDFQIFIQLIHELQGRAIHTCFLVRGRFVAHVSAFSF